MRRGLNMEGFDAIAQCQDVISFISSFFLSTKYPPENSGLENPPVDDFPGKSRVFPHLFVTQGIGQIAQIREMEHVNARSSKSDCRI